MTDEELRRLANKTGIPIKKIAEWHCAWSQGPRPKGFLTKTDINRKRGIPVKIVRQWLRSGLKSRRSGKAVLVNERDLEGWMKEHPYTKPPQGRPPKKS